MQAIMMLIEKYRDCTDFKEILRILQTSSTMQGNFLWQTGPTGKKVIYPQNLEIDFVTRGVAVYFDSNKFSINPTLPLYIKLEYRSSVFKISQFQLGQFGVHFPFPTAIKSMDPRGEKRLPVTGPDDKYIILRPNLHNQPHDAGSELQVRLMDVSPSGVGMMISENNRNFLKNNRFLWMTEIDRHMLKDPILAEVVYMTSDVDHKSYKRKAKELKVGLKLSSQFPNDLMDKVTK